MNLYNDFFKYFRGKLIERESELQNHIKITKHSAGKHYMGYSTGISKLRFYTEYTSKGYGGDYKGFIVGLYIEGDNYKDKLNFFKQNIENIENDLQESLVWLDTGSVGRIFLRYEGDISDKEKWDQFVQFFIDSLIKIVNIFKPYIEQSSNVKESIMNYENQFKKWWFNDGSKKSNGFNYAPNTKSSYFRELERLKNKIGHSIFEVDDLEILNTLLQRLLHGDLKEYNNRLQNSDPSSGLQQYIKFIKNNDEDNHIEYLISRFKDYLRNSRLELKTSERNKKFSVILKNQNITVITDSNKKEFNIENNTKKALHENNFKGSGGLTYAPVVAKYIKNNFSDKDELIKIKNIILYGSPGVGKTHNSKKLISLIESGRSNKEIFKIIKNNELNDGVDIDDIKKRVKFVTFHQSFGYEDFIEGFRPNEDGNIKLQDGIFKTICNNASNDRNNNYYLVIDEINRGNISKIFGELITLIEEDKRDTLEVTLPYSKKPFKIPSNLYIIGTMNSTDKSIALIDIALRRRFTFLKMEPNPSLVTHVRAKEIMIQLNEKITDTLGSDYVLGHSYFMKIESDDDLDFVLEYKIKPLLEEYFYGDDNDLKDVLKICNVNDSVLDDNE